ncbi:MAG TPA: SRPBCC family protein [bacterium]|nr:SRPBCC family protein [bacterium]
MASHIEQKFTVAAPIERVWAFLTDPYQVVACLPGAAITAKVDDQTYEGTVTVKVGPVTAAYKGQVRFERVDAAHWEVEAVGRGQDIKGKGGAEMRMLSRLAAADGGHTEVTVSADVNISGILAQMGRGMIESVSTHVFQQFATAVRTKLEAGGGAGAAAQASEAKPVDALSLGAKAVGDSVRRLFGDKGAG